MAFIAFVLGGTISIYLLSKLIGLVLFRKSQEKDKIIYTSALAFVASIFLSGVGEGVDGSFEPAIFEYATSTLIILALRLGYLRFRSRKDSFKSDYENQ